MRQSTLVSSFPRICGLGCVVDGMLTGVIAESLEEGDDEDDDEEIELDSEAEEELTKNGASALLAQMGKKGKRNGAGEAHDSEDDGPAKKKSRK